MKLISSLLLSLFFASFTFSQEINHKEIDSLLVLLNTKQSDTAKANTYSEICKIYIHFDLNKANEYNEKLLKFSKKTNCVKGIGYYYTRKANILQYLSKFNEANLAIDKAILIFQEINEIKLYFTAYFTKASLYVLSGKSNEGEQVLLKILEESNRLDYTFVKGPTYNLLGNIYLRKENYKKSLLYTQKAIYYYRKSNNLVGMVTCYNQITGIYVSTDQLLKALKYTEYAYGVCIKLGEPKSTIFKAYIFRYKAIVFTGMKKYIEALFYINKVITIESKTGDKIRMSTNLVLLGNIYFELGNYTKTIEIYKEGLKWDYELENIELNNKIGKCYYNLKDYKNALFYQMKALDLINSQKSYKGEFSYTSIYEALTKTEFALGNFKQAYLYQEKYTSLEKQFLLDEKKGRINELQTRFDVNEKEIAIKNLTISKQKRDIEFQKEKNKLMTSSIVLGSSLILLGFISFGYKKNIKKNKVLKEQNQIITTKNIEIESTQGLLVKSLKEKEILLKEIHHRVKNNLQLVMSLLNIQARQGDYFDINDFLEKGQSRIASMALIHQNIYQSENLDRVDFHEYLVNLVENLKNSFSGKQGNIDFSINAKDIYFDIETSIPLGLVINELVCNALKHAFPDDIDGKISIELNQKENNDFELIIKDNGIGIEKTVKSKKSLGLELVSLLVAQLKGKINIESVFGTNYTINFQEIGV